MFETYIFPQRFKSSFLIILIGLVIAFACESPEGIGSDIAPQQSVEVFFTDTMRLELSTVLAEDIETFGTLNLLAGSYEDSPNLGTVRAESYFQMASSFDPVELVLNEEDIPEFDSLVLRLSFGYKYGKSDQSQTFRLYRLSERFPEENENSDITDDIIFTNQDSRQYSTTDFLEIKLTADDFQEDGTVDFTLQSKDNSTNVFSSLGTSILNFMRSDNNSRSEFLTQFPGFALVPEDSDTDKAIIGFNATSTTLLLYYNTGGSESDLFAFFPSIGQRFSKITSSSTSFQPALSSKPASDFGNQTFIQGGTGLMTKVEIPTLTSLDAQGGNVAINLAELVIRPKLGTIEEQLPPPSQLVLYETNESNHFMLTNGERYEGTPSLLDANNRVVNTIQVVTDLNAGNNTGIVQPTFDDRTQEYRFNITSYLQNILNGQEDNKAFLLSTLPFRSGFGALSISTSPSVNRVIIDTNQGGDFAVELRLFYTKFE